MITTAKTVKCMFAYFALCLSQSVSFAQAASATCTAGPSGNPPAAGEVLCVGNWTNCTNASKYKIELFSVTVKNGKRLEVTTNCITTGSPILANDTSGNQIFQSKPGKNMLVSGQTVFAKITITDSAGAEIATGKSTDFKVP